MAQDLAQAENEKSRRNHWTMNCILFGAQLLKKYSQGQITKEEAEEQIKNLSSEISDEVAGYLLVRLDELVKQ